MAAKQTRPTAAARSAADEAAKIRADKIARRECVVDDGTPHMGRAVNGVICSRHANRYDSQGRRRGQ